VDAPTVSGRADRRAAGRYRSYLKAERESAELYRRLAAAATGDRGAALAELAAMEERHAQHWAARLAELGEAVPAPDAQHVRLRTRVLALVARRLSLRAVLPLLERAERADAGMYDAEPAAALGMAREERSHARTLSRIGAGRQARREPWHRPDKSGSLRAAVFGINDGLVSNTALVMGFAGSGAQNQAILLAGVAGLLAGAFSMGAGEYVSVSSQRELFEREIGLEAEELRDKPEEERRELALIYRAKGLDPAAADEIAEQIMRDRRAALDTMAREELGLDPDDLGSPWGVAASSFASFSIGAFVVVLPYLITSGTAALVCALVLASLALLAVGAGIGVLAGRGLVRGAVRQLIVGGLAAGATFLIGQLIGINVT
jgi:VIT1/CCC1 family predicted Fe2+/Mn2+ transporter